MAKKKGTIYVCQECGHSTAKWVGKCPECNEWNTFEEEAQLIVKGSKLLVNSENNGAPQKVKDIGAENYSRVHTGIDEFDRVVGGGIIRGSLVLIGGEPGVGKSTILTSIIGTLAIVTNDKVLYTSGEESLGQVAERARRLGVESDNFFIYHETNWQNILEEIKKIRPKFLVLDSIQTTISNEISSGPGTVSQIREVTYELMNYVKAHDITCFVIGHITKEGSIAGPKILEHMVDTVIYFEGDQFGHYRVLRAIKNRFGNTNEVGIFEMGDAGLKEVANPAQFFLDERPEDSFGRSLCCIIEGSRSLFVEIQALVVENNGGYPRRTTQGVDSNRLSMIIAVIEKYFGISISLNDVYVNVVGGMKLQTRESDLAIIASLLSSFRESPICDSTVFIGEVGLTGEVRSVPQMEMRLKELAQLKYKRVVTSKKTAYQFAGKLPIEVIGVRTAKEIETYID
ncbi:MAG: DNA repair protein RadA [Bacteriovoracaceae bacterium]|nr:DNA repair protein RadA [Bacteriovoracaceae bacterium]